MVLTAQAFELAEVKLCPVTAMVFDMVDDFSWAHEVGSEAPFAQRLASELVPSEPAPTSVVIGTTSIIATNAAAFRMEASKRIAGLHRSPHGADLGGTERAGAAYPHHETGRNRRFFLTGLLTQSAG